MLWPNNAHEGHMELHHCLVWNVHTWISQKKEFRDTKYIFILQRYFKYNDLLSSFHLCFGHRSYKKLHNWLEWNVQIWIFLKRENAIEVIDNHSSPMYSCWKYPHNSISLSTIMHERRLIWHLNLLLPYIYNLLSFSFSFLEKKLLPIS